MIDAPGAGAVVKRFSFFRIPVGFLQVDWYLIQLADIICNEHLVFDPEHSVISSGLEFAACRFFLALMGSFGEL